MAKNLALSFSYSQKQRDFFLSDICSLEVVHFDMFVFFLL